MMRLTSHSTVAATLLWLGCSAPPPGPAAVRPASAPSPQPPTQPLDPSYNQLDPAFSYYAVTDVDELRDHYFVTYHSVEGSYCKLSV